MPIYNCWIWNHLQHCLTGTFCSGNKKIFPKSQSPLNITSWAGMISTFPKQREVKWRSNSTSVSNYFHPNSKLQVDINVWNPHIPVCNRACPTIFFTHNMQVWLLHSWWGWGGDARWPPFNTSMTIRCNDRADASPKHSHSHRQMRLWILYHMFGNSGHRA